MSSETFTVKVTTPAMPAPLSVPLRNVFLTLLLTIITLAASGYVWRESGYEMLIVTMGWPHVILGFLFYFGRVKRGEANARSSFVLLTLLTLTLWIIHYNYAITGLIYLYFLYHAFRDEIFVFLQTRARHRPGPGVYVIAGVAPAILLMLLIPQQHWFRNDLRRVEFSGAQIAREGWTLIGFKPVTNSRARDFYFYLQAPHTAGLRAFATRATSADVGSAGEMLVGDRKWPQAADLVFEPHYAGEQSPPLRDTRTATEDIPVLLTGGHSVGQTFRAERNNLDGLWLPVDRLEGNSETTRFVFHLASPPLLPYPQLLDDVRLIMVVLLGLVVIWKLFHQRGHNQQLWVCLAVVATGLILAQNILRSSNNAGYPFPLVFQFVVVFHYWSWYVFSLDKLRANKGRLVTAKTIDGLYDRLLGYLRRAPHFTVAVIVFNLISAAGVFWYYRWNGPIALRFAFDYNYFLYFLVFHVTFSFKPKLPVGAGASTVARA